MIEYKELEQSKYIVWINYGTEGWSPKTCQTWDDVIETIRLHSDPWMITKPVAIDEPFGKVNNLR